MAVGMIQICDKCGVSWDDGKTSHHFCDPYRIKQKQGFDRWGEMSVEEKLEWLRTQVIESKRNQRHSNDFLIG